MTKDEFAKRRKALGRESPRFDSFVAIALFALAVLGIPLSKLTSDQITFAYMGVLLVLSVAYLVYSGRWAKQTGLLCNACHKPMVRRAGDIAVATGMCPHCKKPAFERVT